MNIELEKVVDVDKFRTSLTDDVKDFDKLLQEATEEITFYSWALNIREKYVGIFYAGIVGVFLFRITPSSEEIDEWVWVIVGDIPPLYMTCEDCPNAACALDGYIGALQEWVVAAENGNSVAELAPVNVAATKENAELLKSRLSMLDERILVLYKNDLRN